MVSRKRADAAGDAGRIETAPACPWGETGRRRPLAQPCTQEKEGPTIPYQHLCDDCGYRYTTHCPLCKDHNRLVKRWRAIEDLARACAWEENRFAAAHVMEKTVPIDSQLPHCYKCGWPDRYEFRNNHIDDSTPFPLTFRDGRWQCNRFGRNDGATYCCVEPGLPAGIPTTVDTQDTPPQPANIEDMTDRKILELVMTLLIPDSQAGAEDGQESSA